MVKEAVANGFDACVICYRGQGGVGLATPKMYNYYAYKDVLEPMKHVYEVYCRK